MKLNEHCMNDTGTVYSVQFQCSYSSFSTSLSFTFDWLTSPDMTGGIKTEHSRNTQRNVDIGINDWMFRGKSRKCMSLATSNLKNFMRGRRRLPGATFLL